MEGPDALRDYYRQWEETFEKLRVEVEELLDAGDQVVERRHRPRQRHGEADGDGLRPGGSTPGGTPVDEIKIRLKD
jgi:hypothetical protein